MRLEAHLPVASSCVYFQACGDTHPKSRISEDHLILSNSLTSIKTLLVCYALGCADATLRVHQEPGPEVEHLLELELLPESAVDQYLTTHPGR